MNLEAIYFVSQVTAAVALVGSLIFVGFQIRQVTERQRREAKRLRETHVSEVMSRMADHKFGPLFIRGSQSDTTLSYAEIARFLLSAVSMMLSARSRFDEYRDGIHPAEDRQDFAETSVSAWQVPDFGQPISSPNPTCTTIPNSRGKLLTPSRSFRSTGRNELRHPGAKSWRR